MPTAYEGTNFISHFANGKIFHNPQGLFHMAKPYFILSCAFAAFMLYLCYNRDKQIYYK